MEGLLPSPSGVLQAYFVLTGLLVVSLNVFPENVKKVLMAYGARRDDAASAGSAAAAVPDFLSKLIARTQVPHSWYWHFYALSAGLSLFWAEQFFSHGRVMGMLVSWSAGNSRSSSQSQHASMVLAKVVLAWCLMALQGARRLWECFFVMRPGTSPMLAVHWVAGLGFYAAMSMAIWVEGSSAILASWESQGSTIVALLSPRVLFSAVVYLAACAGQNRCHRHLASLKKYTLPSEGLFNYIVCPHYTCEIAIYLAIAFLAAPEGKFFNMTILSGLVFVVGNLGTTASGTREWYAAKFGTESVAAKWVIIPGIF